MTGFVVCLLRGEYNLHAANYRCHVGQQVFSCVAGDADEAKRKAEAWCPGEVEVCSCCAPGHSAAPGNELADANREARLAGELPTLEFEPGTSFPRSTYVDESFPEVRPTVQATGACRKCKGTGDIGGNHEREWIKCDECGGSGDAP